MPERCLGKPLWIAPVLPSFMDSAWCVSSATKAASSSAPASQSSSLSWSVAGLLFALLVVENDSSNLQLSFVFFYFLFLLSFIHLDGTFLWACQSLGTPHQGLDRTGLLR